MDANSYLIIGTHFEHGECGACYLFWTGRASGGKLVEITSSPHLKLILSNNNNVINFTGDSWGCSINIYRLNLGGWIDNEIK